MVGALGAIGLASLDFATPIGAAESYTMKLGTPTAATHPFSLAGIHFAQAVARRSNGQLKIDVYPSGQLVPALGFLDALTRGVADFAVTASAIAISPLIPRFQVFDMPFMFKNEASVFRVLDGPIGRDFATELDSKGINVLCWSVDFKEISTTNKTVVVPEDMKGLRMRITNSAVYVAMYQALGAIPIVIDATEAFVALQQRTVDAIDLNLSAVREGKFYTLTTKVAMSNHVTAVNPLFASKRKIDVLPANLQKIIKDEGKALEPFWRALVAKQTAADIQALKDNGVAFNEIQYPAFRKAVDPVYASYKSKLGAEFFDRVASAAS